MIPPVFVLLPVIGKGIGQFIALSWFWIDNKLRNHYCKSFWKLEDFQEQWKVSFYDRAFIDNLKLSNDQPGTQAALQAL